MMQIRLFKKKDARKASNLIRKNLLEINSEEYPESAINFLCGCYTPEKLIEYSRNRKLFVALQSEKIVGTVGLDGNRVRTLFVALRLHGCDIGTKLVSYAEKRVRKKYPRVVVHSSLTAQGFYEKLGYRKTGENVSKERIKTILMSKKFRD